MEGQVASFAARVAATLKCCSENVLHALGNAIENPRGRESPKELESKCWVACLCVCVCLSVLRGWSGGAHLWTSSQSHGYTFCSFTDEMEMPDCCCVPPTLEGGFTFREALTKSIREKPWWRHFRHSADILKDWRRSFRAGGAFLGPWISFRGKIDMPKMNVWLLPDYSEYVLILLEQEKISQALLSGVGCWRQTGYSAGI